MLESLETNVHNVCLLKKQRRMNWFMNASVQLNYYAVQDLKLIVGDLNHIS